MSQTRQLIQTLKRCLRAKGLKYSDLASALELSESSVKRLFSERTFSLQRLEDVCRYLDMTLFDLSRLAASQEDRRADQLSTEQESALAQDTTLLSYFHLLLVGWKTHRIGKRLNLDGRGQDRYLNQLARLKLIELMPRRQVRLLTDTKITWKVNGPVRTRYEAVVKREFIDYSFDGPDEVLKLESSELSDASIKVLQRRIDRLVEEFFELTEIDRSLPREKKRGYGVLLAARQWTFWNVIGELSGAESDR